MSYETPVPTHCVLNHSMLDNNTHIQDNCKLETAEIVSISTSTFGNTYPVPSSHSGSWELNDEEACIHHINTMIAHVPVQRIKVKHCKQEPPDAHEDDEGVFSTAGTPSSIKQEHIDKEQVDGSYVCCICSEKFASVVLFVKHIVTLNHLGERVNMGNNDVISHKFHSAEKIPCKFICQLCCGTYANKASLKAHLRKHAEGQSQKKSGYTCSICCQKFPDQSCLFVHRKTHEKEKNFSCNVCGKRFGQKLHLTQHEVRHFKIKAFNCSRCNAVFSDMGSMTKHIRFKHEGISNYKCSICGKEFMNNTHLQRHLLVHSGEKPYKCSLCDKAFSDNYYLQVHERKHSGENPYVCPVCDKPFYVTASLRSHMLTHNMGKEEAFKCAFCSKLFVTNYKLKRHMKSHTGDRQHVCSICSKSYVERHDLLRHMKSKHIHSHFNTSCAAN